MPHVTIATPLRRFFPDLADAPYSGDTLEQVLEEIEHRHKGFRNYIVDDQGSVRNHVAIAVNEEFVPRAKASEIPLEEDDRLSILQALSGG